MNWNLTTSMKVNRNLILSNFVRIGNYKYLAVWNFEHFCPLFVFFICLRFTVASQSRSHHHKIRDISKVSLSRTNERSERGIRSDECLWTIRGCKKLGRGGARRQTQYCRNRRDGRARRRLACSFHCAEEIAGIIGELIKLGHEK